MKRRTLLKILGSLPLIGGATAKAFNAADFVDADKAKEGLEDMIYHISPMESPFALMSEEKQMQLSAQMRLRCDAMKADQKRQFATHEWTEDILEPRKS